ncbi:MAG: T9SS type A sorting domain-containing protein [Bacteroidales bacterium]|nr:T9SS type A sorting domain-containing protein [Bacteroidales bacterium]
MKYTTFYDMKTSISLKLILSLFFFFLTSTVSSISGQALPQQITPLQNGDKVLFIGNSFSDWHGPLPSAIQSIIKASGSNLKVDFTFKVKGMGILKEYATWESLGIMNEIKKGGWKYVVIQGWMDAIDRKDSETLEDGSLNPNDAMGWPACQDTMLKYLKVMDDEIVKVGAKTILYEPHVGCLNFTEEFNKSHQTYAKLKDAVSVFYAPILNGWEEFRKLYPTQKYECPNENSTGFIKYLYGDCGHQNSNGLAFDAMIFYTLFTQRSAATLNPQFPAKMSNPELYEELADIAYQTGKSILAANNCGFSDTEVPSVPSNLKATNKMPDSFILTWDISSDNIGVLGYNVYKDNMLIGTTATPKFAIGGLSPATSYTMTVKAFDSEKNESDYSEALVVTTEKREEVDAQGILMNWDFNGNNGGTTYSTENLMNGISATAPSAILNSGPVFSPQNNPNAFSVTNQKRVTLEEAIKNNEYFSFTIAPQEGNQISIDYISFIPFSQNNKLRNFSLMSGIKEFTAENAIGNITCDQATNAPTVKIEVTGHENLSEPIEFRIYVWGQDNQWEFFGLDDLKISGAVKTIPLPVFPTELQVADLTETGFTLRWKAAKDAVFYEVYKNGNSCGTTTSLSMHIADIVINESYQMTVKATDSENNVSEESLPLEVTIPDLHAPTTPQNLNASGISLNTFTLYWDASSDNVGVTRYDVYMNDLLYGNTVDSYMPIPYLTPSTTYRMRVKAVDAAGNISDPSEELLVTTLDPTGIVTGENDNNNISIYPNPVSEIAYIDGENKATYDIFLYNTNGNLLQTYERITSGTPIDVSAYSDGVYFIRIINDKQSFIKKLIIQK